MSSDKYFAPPWIKYPFAPKESNFWKNGSGAEYLIKYNENIENKTEFEKIFPKSITFKDNIEPSDNLSENFKNYLKSPNKPIFIKLWSSDAKPKYNPEYIEGQYAIMYDTIFTEQKHIPIGDKHYHSINEIIDLVKNNINDLGLSSKDTDALWQEMKYTVYLNAIYYKIVTDINFINEIIKMGDSIIACYSDNLEFGLEKSSDGTLVGSNLMGLAMMEFRDEIIKEYENYDKIDWIISGKPNSVKRCNCMVHAH